MADTPRHANKEAEVTFVSGLPVTLPDGTAPNEAAESFAEDLYDGSGHGVEHARSVHRLISGLTRQLADLHAEARRGRLLPLSVELARASPPEPTTSIHMSSGDVSRGSRAQPLGPGMAGTMECWGGTSARDCEATVSASPTVAAMVAPAAPADEPADFAGPGASLAAGAQLRRPGNGGLLPTVLKTELQEAAIGATTTSTSTQQSEAPAGVSLGADSSDSDSEAAPSRPIASESEAAGTQSVARGPHTSLGLHVDALLVGLTMQIARLHEAVETLKHQSQWQPQGAPLPQKLVTSEASPVMAADRAGAQAEASSASLWTGAAREAGESMGAGQAATELAAASVDSADSAASAATQTDLGPLIAATADSRAQAVDADAGEAAAIEPGSTFVPQGDSEQLVTFATVAARVADLQQQGAAAKAALLRLQELGAASAEAMSEAAAQSASTSSALASLLDMHASQHEEAMALVRHVQAQQAAQEAQAAQQLEQLEQLSAKQDAQHEQVAQQLSQIFALLMEQRSSAAAAATGSIDGGGLGLAPHDGTTRSRDHDHHDDHDDARVALAPRLAAGEGLLARLELAGRLGPQVQVALGADAHWQAPEPADRHALVPEAVAMECTPPTGSAPATVPEPVTMPSAAGAAFKSGPRSGMASDPATPCRSRVCSESDSHIHEDAGAGVGPIDASRSEEASGLATTADAPAILPSGVSHSEATAAILGKLLQPVHAALLGLRHRVDQLACEEQAGHLPYVKTNSDSRTAGPDVEPIAAALYALEMRTAGVEQGLLALKTAVEASSLPVSISYDRSAAAGGSTAEPTAEAAPASPSVAAVAAELKSMKMTIVEALASAADGFSCKMQTAMASDRLSEEHRSIGSALAESSVARILEAVNSATTTVLGANAGGQHAAAVAAAAVELTSTVSAVQTHLRGLINELSLEQATGFATQNARLTRIENELQAVKRHVCQQASAPAPSSWAPGDLPDTAAKTDSALRAPDTVPGDAYTRAPGPGSGGAMAAPQVPLLVTQAAPHVTGALHDAAMAAASSGAVSPASSSRGSNRSGDPKVGRQIRPVQVTAAVQYAVETEHVRVADVVADGMCLAFEAELAEAAAAGEASLSSALSPASYPGAAALADGAEMPDQFLANDGQALAAKSSARSSQSGVAKMSRSRSGTTVSKRSSASQTSQPDGVGAEAVEEVLCEELAAWGSRLATPANQDQGREAEAGSASASGLASEVDTVEPPSIDQHLEQHRHMRVASVRDAAADHDAAADESDTSSSAASGDQPPSKSTAATAVPSADSAVIAADGEQDDSDATLAAAFSETDSASRPVVPAAATPGSAAVPTVASEAGEPVADLTASTALLHGVGDHGGAETAAEVLGDHDGTPAAHHGRRYRVDASETILASSVSEEAVAGELPVVTEPREHAAEQLEAEQPDASAETEACDEAEATGEHLDAEVADEDAGLLFHPEWAVQPEEALSGKGAEDHDDAAEKSVSTAGVHEEHKDDAAQQCEEHAVAAATDGSELAVPPSRQDSTAAGGKPVQRKAPARAVGAAAAPAVRKTATTTGTTRPQSQPVGPSAAAAAFGSIRSGKAPALASPPASSPASRSAGRLRPVAPVYAASETTSRGVAAAASPLPRSVRPPTTVLTPGRSAAASPSSALPESRRVVIPGRRGSTASTAATSPAASSASELQREPEHARAGRPSPVELPWRELDAVTRHAMRVRTTATAASTGAATPGRSSGLEATPFSAGGLDSRTIASAGGGSRRGSLASAASSCAYSVASGGSQSTRSAARRAAGLASASATAAAASALADASSLGFSFFMPSEQRAAAAAALHTATGGGSRTPSRTDLPAGGHRAGSGRRSSIASVASRTGYRADSPHSDDDDDDDDGRDNGEFKSPAAVRGSILSSLASPGRIVAPSASATTPAVKANASADVHEAETNSV